MLLVNDGNVEGYFLIENTRKTSNLIKYIYEMNKIAIKSWLGNLKPFPGCPK